MARYASPHQLALIEEIVPLDGPELIDGDGPDCATQVENAAAGLAVIEPSVIGVDRDEPARRQPADAPVDDGETEGTETESEDDVEHHGAELACECADEPEEPWVATVNDSDPAAATGAPASARPGPSSTRLGARALVLGVLVLVVVGVAVVVFSSREAQRAAPANHPSPVPVAGRAIPLAAPHRNASTRPARQPQRRRHHRRGRRHHDGHRRRHHAGGDRSRGAPPTPAAASAPPPRPGRAAAVRGSARRRDSDPRLERLVRRLIERLVGRLVREHWRRVVNWPRSEL